MFAAVSVQKIKRAGIYGSILDTIKRRRAEVLEQAAGSCRFFQINSYLWRGRVNFAELIKVSGPFARRLVIDRSVALPPHLPLCRYYPAQFYNMLALNTAIELIERSGLQLYRRVAGLYDPGGHHQSTALALIKYCNTVKICTDRPDHYEDFCRQAMDHFGAPVMMADNLDAFGDCALALWPEDVRLVQSTPDTRERYFPCPLVAGGETQRAAALCLIHHLQCRLPPQWEKHLPPGMSPTYFAGALYELGRVRELGRLAAVHCRIGSIQSTMEEAAQWLRRHANLPSP